VTEPSQLLTVAGLTKSYSALVLDRVNLTLNAGEVHALMGENGAGKSTLARIIAGLTHADAGQMWLAGEAYVPTSKMEAERAGVRLVMQELNLIPTLTVAENIYLDHLPERWGWIQYGRMELEARRLMAEVGLGEIDPNRKVASLGVGQQQLVEIAAGLCRRCRVLILDEPTAALTAPEIERLFAQLRTLTASGVGILYISHRLEEIQQIAQRITVLRDGQVVATSLASQTTMQEVVQRMVGRDLGEVASRQHRREGSVALRVCGLRAGAAVRDVSFELHRGEILGFAGLMGSGRTETMRAIFGADRADAGDIYLRDSHVPARIRSPRDAVQAGMAFLTEDRKLEGLLLPLSVRANITLLQLPHLSRSGCWIRTEAEQEAAERWVEALQVRCASVEQAVGELSGGNQQKVALAKWLFRDSDILMFDEPTRGIDVGAKFEIYQLLTELAAQGKAILMVSSELKELLTFCDRIAVMSAGRLVASFDRGQWTEEKIMAAALSEYVRDRSAHG
jgi:ribose transport system ATP-binding protein